MQFKRLSFPIVLVLIFYNLSSLHAQRVWIDEDFSSPLSDESAWLGDSHHFLQTDLGWQLNSSQSGRSRLLHYIPTLQDEISFEIETNFLPSSANRFDLILQSDSFDLDQAWNGYLIQFGENGSSDKPKLYEVKDGSKTKLLLTLDQSIAEGGIITFKMQRSPQHSLWNFTVNEQPLEAIVDIPFIEVDSLYAGFHLHYTSSNTQGFLLKNFSSAYQSPSLKKVEPELNTFQLSFSHPIKCIQKFLINGLPVEDLLVIEQNQIQVVWPDLSTRDSIKVDWINLELKGAGLLESGLLYVKKPDRAENGEILISEFLYKSTDRLAEFVEIYNTSSKAFRVKDLAIADTRDTTYLSEFDQLLYPKQWMLIGSNLAPLGAPETALNIEQEIPSLNNGGDQIRLLFGQKTIDMVAYEANWSSTGESVERRSFAHPSELRTNWEESDLTGSLSPGKPNTIQQDEEAPDLINFEFLPTDTLKFIFNEAIKFDSLWINILPLNSDIEFEPLGTSHENELKIWLKSNLPKNEKIDLELHGISDLFDNQRWYRFELFLKQTNTPERGELIITEFLADPLDQDVEFIELYNPLFTNKTFDLSDFSFVDASGKISKIEAIGTDNLLVKRGEYIALGPTTNTNTTFWRVPGFPSLNNQDEKIELWYKDSILVDIISWTELPKNESSGISISMEKTDPFSDGRDPSKWLRSKGSFGNTAAQQNSHFELDQIAPELIQAEVLSMDTLILHFDEFVRPNNTLEHALWLDALYTRVQYKAVDSSDFSESTNKWLALLPKGALQNTYSISLDSWKDTRNNVLLDQDYPLVYKPKASQLVINEIFFDPLADPNDFIADQHEWIELFNPSLFHLSLNELIIHQGINEKGFISAVEIAEPFIALAPNEFALIYSEHDQSLNLDELSKTVTYKYSSSGLSLSNDSSQVYISLKNARHIDSILYRNDWHHPALQEQKGVSLERIRSTASGFISSNWGSSTNKTGHSAGKKNSLTPAPSDTTLETQPSKKTKIRIHPFIFSPNGDGKDEICTIQVESENQHELLNARIFDRSGYLIQTLTESIRPGNTELFQWDGRDDQNRNMAAGVYLLHISWRDIQKRSQHESIERIIIAPY